MSQSLIPFPIGTELIGLFFIGSIMTTLVVYTDISMFDDYVGLGIEVCYAENQETFCREIRDRLGLPSDAQIEIGNSYWRLLQIQAIVLPLGFLTFRLLMVKLSRHPFDALRVFTIILWGAFPLILFLFGVVDVFYYLGRGMEIPDQLMWLNHVGVLEHTKSLGMDELNVEKNDLLITFGLGVSLIFVLFFFATIMYKGARLRTTMV